MRVPELDLDSSTKFASWFKYRTTSSNEEWTFNGPTISSSRHAVAVSAGATILPIEAPLPNSSYLMQFNGPAVKCRPANQSEMIAINQTWWDIEEPAQLGFDYNFYAFVPLLLSDGSYSPAEIFPSTSLGWEDEAITNSLLCSSFAGPADYDTDTGRTDTKCQLYNASYSVKFVYSDGEQSTDLQSVVYSDLISYTPTPDDAANPSTLSHPAFSYQAIGMALYQQIVGYGSSAGFTTRIHWTSLAAASDIQIVLSHSNPNETNLGLENLLASNRTVGALIEELSHNITISLLSDPSFR
jgi:hypothetical protein